MTVLSVRHRTEYKYRDPVKLGEHRLMSRPRDSHDLRLLDTTLLVVPQPSELRWLHDVFGNSILIATFTEMSDSVVFESAFRAEHFPLAEQTIWLEPYARQLPFNYSGDDSADLGRSMERQYPDPEHAVDQWAKKYVDAAADRIDAGCSARHQRGDSQRLCLCTARGIRRSRANRDLEAAFRKLSGFRSAHDGGSA